MLQTAPYDPNFDRDTIVYLDYAATAPLLPVARTAMLEIIDAISYTHDGADEGIYGNASSLHLPGNHAHDHIEQARWHVAELINAKVNEIVFTSGGSEANNTVANIFAGQRVATSAIEHPSVLKSLQARATHCELIPVDSYGFVNPADVPTDVDLVSVMLANNELGSIEPISEIAQRLRNASQDHASADNPKPRTPYFHTDATQALGKIPIDVKALGVDYMTISAHKIGGPIGVGALYVRDGAPFRPLILGGHQENRRRAGTSNTLAIVGFGAAAKWYRDDRNLAAYQDIRRLRDRLAQRILKEVPYSSLNSPLENSLPHILNVSFQAAEGESIQLYLDARGISVSTGSACAAGDLQPSPVLMATKHDAEIAHNSIRFSLGPNTTANDIDRVMKILPGIIQRLQGISTVKIKETPNGSK